MGGGALVAAVEVIREPVPAPPVKEVVLRLTDEEAAAVTAVLGNTVGDPPFYSIYQALIAAGYGYSNDTDRNERLQKASGLS